MKLVQFNILVRQWMRGGVSTAVSLVSLSLGLICSTILLLFAVEEFKAADSLIPNPQQKYLLMTGHYSQKGNFQYNIFKTVPGLVSEKFPQILDHAVIKDCDGVWMDEEINFSDQNRTKTMAVTPSFTKYYKIPVIEGNLDSVLAAPDRIALTREYAARLFPDKNPIGQTVTGVFDDTLTRSYTVTAIIDNSKRAALSFRAIYQLNPNDLFGGWQRTSYYSVMHLAPGTDPASIEAKMAKDSVWKSMPIKFKPLDETYFQGSEVLANSAGQSEIFKTRSKESLYIGVAIAFAILVIAAFNYINITLTRSASRLKNLAGQRIMGATKWGIRGQIFTDTALNVGLAFILALVFLPLSMEGFNGFMNATISMSDLVTPVNLLCVLALLAVLIVIPSVSLIVKFSIRNPLETFKNPEGRKLKAAQPLVVAQIVISVILMTYGITVSRQMTYTANSMPIADQVLEVHHLSWKELPKAFVDQVKSSASTSQLILGRITPNNFSGTSEFQYQWTATAPEFFDLFQIKLIEGRTFDRTVQDEYINVVANRSLVKAMEIKGTAVGQIFNKKYRIVGVCEDQRVENSKAVVLPGMYLYDQYYEEEPNIFYVRFKGSAENKIAEMQKIFERTSEKGTLMPQMQTVADMFLMKNPEITRMKTMIDVFTTISFLLTAFGLFGLSWYMVERRRREIAIRKTYGATVAGMVAMLCRSFLWQSLIAIVIALPAAYFISGYWLEGFVFRVDNAWWVLAISAGLTLVVIFVTVIGQTIRAALTNPVKYIKTE